LTERGWPTEGVGDDGLQTEVSPEQRDAFDAARDECLVETGYHQEVESLTEDGVAEWYEALVLKAACLEGMGFTIGDAPTKQTFVDSYFEAPASTWNPYPEPSSLADWAEIEETCPQPGSEGEPVQSF
jgi:hypothetical protein